MNIIEIKNLSVKYRNVKALGGVSLQVKAGDYVGVVGPNGSGKTTLVKAILGLLPFEGRITFQGMSFSQFRMDRHVGYLPQKMAVQDMRFPATAKEIVASGVYCCKKFPIRLDAHDYTAAEEAMRSLGIINLKDRPIGKLSGGQQQRVLLARTLVHSPEILILDEPTVALDPQSREAFYKTVEILNKEKKVTVLLVTHDVVSVGKYASKLLYLDREVIFYGTFESFCKSAQMSDYFGPGQHVICHRH